MKTKPEVGAKVRITRSFVGSAKGTNVGLVVPEKLKGTVIPDEYPDLSDPEWVDVHFENALHDGSPLRFSVQISDLEEVDG